MHAAADQLGMHGLAGAQYTIYSTIGVIMATAAGDVMVAVVSSSLSSNSHAFPEFHFALFCFASELVNAQCSLSDNIELVNKQARMKSLLAGALAAGASASALAGGGCQSKIITPGTVPVTVDGQTSQWSIAVAGGANAGTWVNANGSMTMRHNDRGYLVNLGSSCPDAFDADMLLASRLSLVGKTMNYTVDLSTVGCACNAAFYMTSMPGYNASNQPDPTTGGDYYCDANDGEFSRGREGGEEGGKEEEGHNVSFAWP